MTSLPLFGAYCGKLSLFSSFVLCETLGSCFFSIFNHFCSCVLILCCQATFRLSSVSISCTTRASLVTDEEGDLPGIFKPVPAWYIMACGVGRKGKHPLYFVVAVVLGRGSWLFGLHIFKEQEPEPSFLGLMPFCEEWGHWEEVALEPELPADADSADSITLGIPLSLFIFWFEIQCPWRLEEVKI